MNHAVLSVTPKRAVKLVAGDALLAAGQQIDGLQPQVQRDVALLEDGADLHAELLAAGVALVEADAGALPAILEMRSTDPQWGQTGPSGHTRASTQA